MKTTATKRAKVAAAAAKDLPVNISHPDKVFWPEDGYTKGDLAEFYVSIFSKLEPYVRDRLLTLERCPDGMAGQCFYQKEMPKGMPASTPTKRIKNEESKRAFTNYVVGGSLETQLALVNLGCIAIHAMGGRAERPRRPDWICFDLDPDSGEFSDASRAALYVKEGLDTLKLESFAKTSGSRGVHVFVPMRAGPDVDVVRSFAQEFSARLVAAHPKELTTEHSIAGRKGRVYLDPFRNGFGQTVVTPYSVRRKPKAPVSTPLAWTEVKTSLIPSTFNIGNFAERAKKADPWSDFFRTRQPIEQAIQQVKKL
jgi:bifunctional non-homologous end joining protein LigD